MVRDRTNRRVVSPGQILREDVLPRLPEELQDQGLLADRLGVSRSRFNGILNGRRPVTLDSALRLARLFGTTPEYWLKAQMEWDLHQARRSKRFSTSLDHIDPLRVPVLDEPERSSPASRDLPATGEALTLQLAAAVTSARLVDAGRNSSLLPYYREFLERRDLLKEAERYVKIRSNLDQIENGRPRVLPTRIPFPSYPARFRA